MSPLVVVWHGRFTSEALHTCLAGVPAGWPEAGQTKPRAALPDVALRFENHRTRRNNCSAFREDLDVLAAITRTRHRSSTSFGALCRRAKAPSRREQKLKFRYGARRNLSA
ncbi:hypothetical protein PsYK624_077640 [Phanerochaete sordida]|uniref:Uncharacterized protein n=1 Tax=Phanerochaete sordida TaxID=48140 RepID=A0A9P3LEH5_9APHY|nr:hypothetical protein PsYK624_077640 [Phanerochaete sordida]